MTGYAERMLAALKAHEAAKPRSKQVRLGPSELGGCREYVRNVMVGSPMQESDVWPTAAVMGTLAGAHLEAVAAEHLGALTEVPVTATLPNGLKVSGHADIVIVEENAVLDAKSKDGLSGVRREGPSLENLIQISVYTVGLVQARVLEPGATAHLIYVDRSGNEQELYEVSLDWETILSFIDKCVDRLDEVVQVQEYIDQGDVSYARSLRDKTPPFCYSPKVMCPFRDLCWKGSEWVPDKIITDEEVLQAVFLYDEARALEKEAAKVKAAQREKLVGVSGKTPSGLSVTWTTSGRAPALYVTQVGEKS